MKKVFYLLIVLVLCISLCTNMIAIEYVPFPATRAINIETIPIPQEATDYAVEVFSGLHASELFGIGFTETELCELSLSPGFQMINEYTGQYIDNVYIFLIKSGDKFVATLLVSYYNGEYGFQISKTDYTAKINDIDKNSQMDYKLIVSEDMIYCYSGQDIDVLASKDGHNENNNIIAVDMFNNTNYNNSITINILDSVYGEPEKLNDSDDVEKILEVPYCDNYYNGYYGNRIDGVCWAASAGSIIAFIKNDASHSADYYKNGIVTANYDGTRSYGGTVSDACRFIKIFTGREYSALGYKLGFVFVQQLIYSGDPGVIGYSPVNCSEGHAVVLCGFSHPYNDPHTPANQKYYIMDPNSPNIKIMVGYNSLYCGKYLVLDGAGGYVYPQYAWTNTGANKDDLPSNFTLVNAS